jgi:hypothetical protein
MLKRRRRTIAALASAGLADFAVISLYQMGAIRHLPDPPIRAFDSDRVAGAAAVGAGAAVYDLWDMFARERRACAYCLVGSALNLSMLPLALGDRAEHMRERRAH